MTERHVSVHELSVKLGQALTLQLLLSSLDEYRFCHIHFKVIMKIFSRESDSRDSVVRQFVSNVSNTLSSINFHHQTTLIIN